MTIKADSLEELVILKTIANSLQRRVSANYRFVLTFNSALIALGAMGILQPASSAMLHNLSTIGISLKSMTNLIPEEKAQKALAEKELNPIRYKNTGCASNTAGIFMFRYYSRPICWAYSSNSSRSRKGS